MTISTGSIGLLPPTAASAPSPACLASMTSVRSRGSAAARSARPGRGDHVRRRVDQLARRVGPAADERGAVRNGREVVAAAADHEALDAARKAAAPPAAALVAADDGAFGQRAHLLVDGDGQRRVERPGDRPAVAARAHRVRGGGPQPVGVGLERHDGQRGAGRVHHRHRIGIRHRALRGTQLPCPRPRAAAIRSAPTARGSPAVTSTSIGWTLSVNSHTLIGGTMTWVKPKFEIVELCSEVTSYVFHR